MILIKNGNLVSHQGITSADILVSGSRIAKVGRSLRSSGAETIDATGLFVLPGAIDSHVHFRDPENRAKEDFSTGSASALAGGVTTVMDMPNYRNPPTTTIAAYKAKQKAVAVRARCDYLLRFGASESNQQEAARSGAPQLKIFLSDTGSELGCSRDAAIAHLRAFPKSRAVCVHAEDRERIAKRRSRYSSQSQVQDKLSSVLASEFTLREAAKLGRRVHLCHLTTAREVRMCRRYLNATYEVSPNHLFLSTTDLHSLGELGRVNPPLREPREKAALWRTLGPDTIIASDHAPHLVAHKLAGAPGFPGVGTLLPLMLNAAHERKVALSQVVRMCCYNPARAFGLARKGQLRPGMDADVVLVDMDDGWRISADNRLSKCGWTPFEGREAFGRIESVWLRGQLAYDGESVLAKPGYGKEIG